MSAGAHPGYVYLIQSGEWHKIGFSENPQRRLAEIECWSIDPCMIVCQKWSNDALRLEGRLHARFAGQRHRREWFRLTPADVEWFKNLDDAEIVTILDQPVTPPTEPVRMPRSFARKLRRLALHAEMDPGDYLAKKFGAALDREHAKMLEELAEEESEGGKR